MAFAIQRLKTLGAEMRHQQTTRQFIGPNIEHQSSGTVGFHLAIKSAEQFQRLITQWVLRFGGQDNRQKRLGAQRQNVVLDGLQAFAAVLGAGGQQLFNAFKTLGCGPVSSHKMRIARWQDVLIGGGVPAFGFDGVTAQCGVLIRRQPTGPVVLGQPAGGRSHTTDVVLW